MRRAGSEHGARSGTASGAALAGCIALCVVGGAASGLATPPGDWYASLAKPSWARPGWLFGPVWTALYAMMGVSAWRLWRMLGRAPGAGRSLVLFGAQLAFNFAWTPVFFGMRAPGAALAVIVVLWAFIAATIASSWRVDRAAGGLLVPYLAWVTFATALNAAIWRIN